MLTEPTAKGDGSTRSRRREKRLTHDPQIPELVERAKSLPEIRQDRVDAIRGRLREGRFDVDPRAVARAILEFEDDFGGH